MATGPGFPQTSNVFIPNWEASGKLAIGFCRNPKAFKINDYVQFVRSPKIKGYYLKFTNQEQVRVPDQQRYAWPYGKPAPVPTDPESFNFLPFTIKRNAYAYGADTKATKQADFNLMEVERKGKTMKAMTARSQRIISLLTTAANYQTSADPDLSSNHTATATALVGGKLSTGTSTNPVILAALNAMANQISIDTNGQIENQPGSFKVVIRPDDAQTLAKTPEIKDFIKGSPDARADLEGKLTPNTKWGLPGRLYGYELVIENAVQITAERGATLARTYVWPQGSVAMVSRAGEMEGVYGEQSFSTFCVFYGGGDDEFEDGEKSVNAPAGIDMIVEEFIDRRNKMWEGRIIEETAEVMTCPASGYLLTAAV